MRILVDENIPRMTGVRALGHDVRDVRGTPDQGLKDPDLWSAALADRRIVITTDRGFTEFRAVPHSGVLIVRLRQPNRLKIHHSVMLARAGGAARKLNALYSGFFLAPLRHPAGLVHLTSAAQRERAWRNLFRDHAARADVAVRADLKRRDQGRVAADERTLADAGLVLLLAVVVAGDGARADIRCPRRSAQSPRYARCWLLAPAPSRVFLSSTKLPMRVSASACAPMRSRAKGPICAPASMRESAITV